MTVLLIALLILSGALAGAISGGLSACWIIRRQRRRLVRPPLTSTDPALNAEIERAARVWANAQARPATTGMMADKLHLLHRIGQRRGWWR